MNEYEDIKHLWAHGMWPNGDVPEWAEAKARELHTGPANAAVIEHGLVQEIERLRKELYADGVTQPCGHAARYTVLRDAVDKQSERYCLFCEVERLRSELASQVAYNEERKSRRMVEDLAVCEQYAHVRSLLTTAVDAFESGNRYSATFRDGAVVSDVTNIVTGIVSREWLVKAKEVLGE